MLRNLSSSVKKVDIEFDFLSQIIFAFCYDLSGHVRSRNELQAFSKPFIIHRGKCESMAMANHAMINGGDSDLHQLWLESSAIPYMLPDSLFLRGFF